MQNQRKQVQTFNSGLVEIYETENSAAPGKMPKQHLKSPCLYSLRFDERIVGYGRRSLGLQSGMKVDKLFRCPRHDNVTTKCVAVHNGTQYKINQVQFPPDVLPPVMDLSLERVETDAAFEF